MRRRSRSSTSRPARARSSPASAATTPARSGCPTGRSSTCRTPTAGSRSSAARRMGVTGSSLTDGEREHGEPSGGYRLHPAAVAGRQPRRAHRGPRRPHRPDRAQRRRRRAAQARPRPAAQGPANRGCRHDGRADLAVGRRVAGRRLAARRRLGRGDRRERDAAAGPVAAARPGRRARRRPPAPGHRFPARPCWRPRLAAGRVPAGERIAFKARDGLRVEGHAVAPEPPRPASAAASACPTIIYPHGGPTWQAYRSVPAVQAAAGARGLRLPRRRLPRLDRLRPRVPPGQPRRVGPRRRPRPHRRRPLGAGTAVVRRAPRDLRRVVRRLHGPVRARRGARAVRGRASTCTATPRSPRASATATGRGAWTCSR